MGNFIFTKSYGLRVPGGYRKSDLRKEADKYQVGEFIRYQSGKTSKDDGVKVSRSGIIVGKYEHFMLIDNGRWKDTVLWVDMIGKISN